jgi:hypothetical protein
MKTSKTISKRRLQKYLDDLIALAKNLTPEVETVIQIPGDDGQHAWLEIYVPDELVDQADALISERVYDMFVIEGYDIGAIVYEKSQLQPMAATANE